MTHRRSAVRDDDQLIRWTRTAIHSTTIFTASCYPGVRLGQRAAFFSRLIVTAQLNYVDFQA